MPDNSHLAAVLVESSQIRELLVRTRETIAASKKLMGEPTPDTFLGRGSFGPLAQVNAQSVQSAEA